MARGEGSGWHGESRRHAEAAKKGRPTHAKARPVRTKPVKKAEPSRGRYNTSHDAWNHLVSSEWTARDFMDHFGKGTIAESVDAYLAIPSEDRVPGSNAREMLIKYIEQDMGSDRLRAYTRTVDGPRDHEWADIVADYQNGSNPFLPTEQEVIDYIKAGAFDPDAVLLMHRHGITPDMASQRTNKGLGHYNGTIAYKISNSDMDVDEAKAVHDDEKRTEDWLATHSSWTD